MWINLSSVKCKECPKVSGVQRKLKSASLHIALLLSKYFETLTAEWDRVHLPRTFVHNLQFLTTKSQTNYKIF